MELKEFQNPPNGDSVIERSEESLSKIVNKLRGELQKSNCGDNETIELANFWLKTTRKVHSEEIKIETGAKVTITIKRDSLEWTFVFKGDERGQWVTTYGFGFTSQRLESRTYISKQISDTTVFQLLESRRAKVLDLNYVPAVFFSYFPSQRFNSCWNHSLTAGLGFDLSSPVVFLGYNGLFYHNIGLSIGIAFQQQYRLKDQYSENEIVSIALDKGQLHDQIYRPNLFVSINYRLGESPFKTKNEADKE